MISRTLKIIAYSSMVEDSKVPLCIFKKGVDLCLRVSAKPSCKKYAVTKIDDESVQLAVKAPPKEGAAN